MSEITIEYEFDERLLRLEAGEMGERVLSSLSVAMSDLQREVEGAYQPERMRDAYSVETGVSGGDAWAQLTNESGVLFPSFVYGSQPHFPPWRDPDLVEWANARGIPVATSDYQAMPEVVGHGRAGSVTRQRDSGALAEALLFLLDPVNNAKARRQAANWFDAHYTPVVAVSKLAKAYDAAMRRRTSNALHEDKSVPARRRGHVG